MYLLTFARKWMELETILLREIARKFRKVIIACFLSYVESKRERMKVKNGL
jgi:hypothetical protein